eukprot:TRINITY_DN3889_c0_g1_i1.p1 TRINITY_DN3889_c0_g1~~TRINITY_DN3889_c0_g1_i1.p1  ORF type:complete len:208 (+),score=50.05 TRINITY_DN3889_c0_g1_i1:252-875(+)
MEELSVATMPAEENDNEKKTSSYRYWVRNSTADAAPLPLPKKLSAEDLAKQQAEQSKALGSVWNQAGTWEERNLSCWASTRIKELLSNLDSLQFSRGKANITEVASCTGEATVVTVRNKKRIGYSFDISLKFKGEWLVNDGSKEFQGTLKVPEASYGDLEEMEMNVQLNEEKEIAESEKNEVVNDLKKFVVPLREKLFQLEAELKSR